MMTPHIGFMKRLLAEAGVDTVWDLPATAGRTVTISADRSNLRAAPEHFSFDVTTTGFTSNVTAGVSGSYDPGFHNLLVFWDYGESYNFTAPTQIIALDASDGGDRQNSQFSTGPLGAHTYRTPGNHVVRVAVYEPSSGTWGQGTYRIGGASEDTPEILAASVVFPGTQTIHVDPTGTHTNAPAGAALSTSIHSAAENMRNATLPTRCVLARGQTHTFTGSFNLARYLSSPASVLSWRIEAEDGPGADPIVTINDANFGPGSTLFNDALTAGDNPSIDSDNAFINLDLRGLWDTTTETGDSCDFLGLFDQSATYTLFDGCTVTGWKILCNVGGGRVKNYAINDTSSTNWQYYGLSYDASQVTKADFVGCAAVQDVDALAGGPTDPENSRNNQGPMRNAASARCYISRCDIFSNTGWNASGALRLPQPCIRVLQNMTSGGKKCYIEGGVFEGGGKIVAVENSQEGNVDVNVNFRMSGPLLIAAWQTGVAIGVNYSGVTIEGGTTIVPGIDRRSTSIGGPDAYPMAFMTSNSSGAGAALGAYSDPVRYFNWTMVNLLSDSQVTYGNAACPIVDGGNIPVTQSNNIVHQPNIGTPQVASAPLTRVQRVTPRYKGYQDASVSLATQFATPATAGSIYVPAAGSSAIDAATSGDIYRLAFVPDYSDGAIISTRDAGCVQTV